jgi:hypothetical protein
MSRRSSTSRVLGIAFLLQFVTSVASGVFVQPALIVSGDIVESMMRIASHTGLMRLYILLDMLTALGVIFLGAMLYITLKKGNEKVALVALGFYILEGALLGASKLQTFSLLRMSQLYVTSGQPSYLQTMATLAFESADFVGFQLHMLAFCLGGILFYTLLYKSGIVPRGLSLWGLITVTPLLVATILALFEVQVPPILAVPYIPFELVIGLWIAAKGIRDTEMYRPTSP